MRVKDTVRMVVGSVAIYVVVAACSSNSGTIVYPGDSGKGSDAKNDAKARADAKTHPLRDALTDPVAEAMADENKSGTRLHTQHYTGSDGSSQFVGFYDTMLKVACTFVIATDTTTRCMPTGNAVASLLAYSDSGCTTHIAQTLTSCGTPTYAAEAVGNAGCPSVPEVQAFAIGAPYTGTVYGGTTANCTAIPATQLTQLTFYTLGNTMAATAFVSATVKTD